MPASPRTLGQTWPCQPPRIADIGDALSRGRNRATAWQGTRRATVEVDGAPGGPQPGALRSLQETAPPPGYRQAARGQRRRSITSARPAHWIETRSRACARPAGPEGLQSLRSSPRVLLGSSPGLPVSPSRSEARRRSLNVGLRRGRPCRSAWRQRTERVPRDYQPEGEDALVPPEVVLLVNFLVGAVLLVVATSGLLGRWLSRHSVALVALAALPLLTAVLLTVSTSSAQTARRGDRHRPLGTRTALQERALGWMFVLWVQEPSWPYALLFCSTPVCAGEEAGCARTAFSGLDWSRWVS